MQSDIGCNFHSSLRKSCFRVVSDKGAQNFGFKSRWLLYNGREPINRFHDRIRGAAWKTYALLAKPIFLRAKRSLLDALSAKYCRFARGAAASNDSCLYRRIFVVLCRAGYGKSFKGQGRLNCKKIVLKTHCQR